jgi:hypothetical protein
MRALKHLTRGEFHELQEMPDLCGLTALDSLTIEFCGKLRALPRGIGELGSLTQLTLWSLDALQEMPDLIRLTATGSLKFECGTTLRALPRGIGELPCIEALTALQELELNVANYTQGGRAFTALSRLLPCLQQLRIFRLQASDLDDDGDAVFVALRAGDVLAIGRAHKAWPLPLLHVDVNNDNAEEKMRRAQAGERWGSRQRPPMRTGPTR